MKKQKQNPVYLKQQFKRNAGKIPVVKFIKVLNNKIVYVDTTRNKIAACKTFGALPHGTIEPITEKEFETAYKKVYDLIFNQ